MTENRETDGSGARNPALDAVRAAAALVVVIGHALTVAGLCEGPSASAMAQFVVAAVQPAVDLFFVLSGYVLAAGAAQRANLRFVAARAVRLLPVMIVAVGFAVLLRPYAGGCKSVVCEEAPVSWQAAVKILAFVGSLEEARKVDPPLWTIGPEFWCSALVPLVAGIGGLARRAVGGFVVALAAVGLAVAGLAAPGFVCAPFVLAGAVIAGAPAAGRVRWLAMVAGTLGLVACAMLDEGYAARFPTTAAACLVVWGAASLSVWRGGLARWAGRISYPLYALHFPLLAAGAQWGAVGITTAAGISVMAAAITELVVDAPAIALARRVRGQAASTMTGVSWSNVHWENSSSTKRMRP